MKSSTAKTDTSFQGSRTLSDETTMQVLLATFSSSGDSKINPRSLRLVLFSFPIILSSGRFLSFSFVFQFLAFGFNNKIKDAAHQH